MRYASKRQLVADIRAEHQRFRDLARSIPVERYTEAGIWGDDWTIKDLFAHLTAWEQLFLSWHRQGLDGLTPELPSPGYRWNQTPALNREIWKKYRDSSWDEVCGAFDTSYDEIVTLASSLSEPELLEPKRFPWTGRNALVTYLGANTASHYRTASKILKRWLRHQALTSALSE